MTAVLFLVLGAPGLSLWAKTVKVCFSGYCVNAEIADTEANRMQGLMHRKHLGEDQGMLFVFEQEGRYGFWMKNMRFPIDIIWIGKDKTVAGITEYAQPCQARCRQITPRKPYQYALEVKAGFARRHNISPGSKVSF